MNRGNEPRAARVQGGWRLEPGGVAVQRQHVDLDMGAEFHVERAEGQIGSEGRGNGIRQRWLGP